MHTLKKSCQPFSLTRTVFYSEIISFPPLFFKVNMSFLSGSDVIENGGNRFLLSFLGKSLRTVMICEVQEFGKPYAS